MKFLTKQSYKVTGFEDSCPQSYMQKLLSLGFVPNAHFYIEKKALFGNPYHIILKHFSVTLRQSELDYIKVEAL